jgi:hypothetical protein
MSLWRYATPPYLESIQLCIVDESVSNTVFVFSTYRSLTPKTRALFGVGVMAWATIGLWTSPQVESALGMQATKDEQEVLDKQLAVRISRVGGEGKDERAH